MRDLFWEQPKARDFHGYLYTVNDGSMDVEGFLDSAYGAEMARRLAVRFAIETEREKAAAYYATLGLKADFFRWEDYYGRWILLSPLAPEAGRRYPLVFWLHGAGNSIEGEANMTGFPEVAAREGFMVAVPQNTNPSQVIAILDQVKGAYPLDEGKVYLAGFSQGGAQCHGAYFRHPERFAAAVTAGNDIWQPWDNMQVSYTDEEIERTRTCRVPLMQFVGQCEPFPYAPLNSWAPLVWRCKKPWGRPCTDDIPGNDNDLDPTRIHDLTVGRFDSDRFGDTPKKKWRMAEHYEPKKGEDIGRWALARVNYRLGLLDCPPRDVETCLGFDTLEQDQVRRVCGIYGDYEAVEYLYGYRHYTVGVNDRSGHEMYRFVCVQNSPHWPPLATAEEGWKFMKRFRRDAGTGELIFEED